MDAPGGTVGSGHWTPRVPAHVASETGTGGGVGLSPLKSSASPTVTRWNANLVRRDDMPNREFRLPQKWIAAHDAIAESIGSLIIFLQRVGQGNPG